MRTGLSPNCAWMLRWRVKSWRDWMFSGVRRMSMPCLRVDLVASPERRAPWRERVPLTLGRGIVARTAGGRREVMGRVRWGPLV